MAAGKVIKSDTRGESTAGGDRSVGDGRRRAILDSEVYEAHQQAQAIIESAQRKALEVMEAAKRQSEEVFQKAREAGRQAGLAEVTKTWAQNHLLRGKMLAEAETEILKLACKVAEKILGRDLERQPELVVDICATAIENVRNARQLILRVNPKDAALLRERRKQLMDLIGRVQDIGVKEDPDVAPHGCVIETDSGTVDAQLATQLEMLLNVLVPDTARREGPR